jgi:hypothetical protein
VSEEKVSYIVTPALEKVLSSSGRRELEKEEPRLKPLNDAFELERPALVKLRNHTAEQLGLMDWAIKNEMPYMWVPEFKEQLDAYQTLLDARVAAIQALQAEIEAERRK